MEYRVLGKTGEKISALGFGCMRLPVIDGNMKQIDEPEAIRMIRYAVDHGVNYIDTAYVYHEGTAEGLVAKALKDGYRKKILLATKLPIWNVENRADMVRLLDEQLNNLETDCIDFYLVHALNKQYWSKLLELGLLEFLLDAKEKGKVKHLGFSFHDNYSLFKEIVDGFDWSFCQIQYNYLDEDFQAGRKGLEYAWGKGLGVVIMEPLKGGTLVKKLTPEAYDFISKASIQRTPAELALKWVWDHPEVGIVLSGMSEMSQVEANVKYASESSKPLTAEETKVIQAIQQNYRDRIKINCTDCKYCMPCPSGVDIPQSFNYYNRAYMFDDIKGALFWYNRISKASNCSDCGKCEEHCPQNIPIRERLKDVKGLFED
ncbi:MAG: aldo/keto reductase [Gracilibacter sp. BRH_c7a]|nr:MAG: aldo/keto reductase [Gracilibacter sp. BRH_c7a]